MSTQELIVAGCLLTLAAAHSVLGETDILRPLFATEWTTTKTPRWATERILRFAWHLTSVSWIAIALAVLDVPLLLSIAAMSLVSAGMIFVMLRGHLAWPLFLLAGVAALHADGHLGEQLLQAAGVLTALVLLATAGVHVYWASGGQWMFDRAVPTTSRPSHTPGPFLTLLVAGGLTAFAALVGFVTFDAGPQQLRWCVIAGVIVFCLRAIGDTKVAGFTKTVRTTAFAIADDRWFTPLIVFLALGATGALLA